MSKKKLRFFILITLVFVLALSGCNKEKPETEGDGSILADELIIDEQGNDAPEDETSEELEDFNMEDFELELGEKAKITKEEIENFYNEDLNMLLYFNDFSGRPAPDFEMTDLNGKKLKLSDFKGENVIIEFMGSWCPVCAEATKNSSKFNDEYKDAKIISVSVDDTIETLKKFNEENNIKNMEYYIPTDEKTYELYDIFFVPIYFYVDKDGYIQMILAGDAPLEMLVEYADKSFK